MTSPDRLPPMAPTPLEEIPPPPVTSPVALVCLGWVAWGYSWKRNQSMVYHLSQSEWIDRVVFINPRDVWVRNELISEEGSLRERVRRVFDSLPRSYDETIRVCSMIRFAPLKRVFPVGHRLEEWLFRRIVQTEIGHRPYVLLNNHPNFFAPRLLDELMKGAVLRVFDVSDDFVEFFDEEAHRQLFERNLASSCSRSDLVFTVNQHVKDKYGRHNPNTHVVPNSTNYSNFDRPEYRPIPELDALRATGRPILGYTGIINRIRVDYELLEELIGARPDAEFVFVGSCDPSFLDVVARHPNLHHFPQVHYDVLPDYIEYFDAAIIPFRVNEHTRGNDLLKFNDYLAMGKSIVTTDTGGAQRYADWMWIAQDTTEFLRGIEAACAPVEDGLRCARKKVAESNSWNHRAHEIQAMMMEQLER